MTALAANAQSFELREGWQLEQPVKAAEIIYKGSPVFKGSDGYVYTPDGSTNTITLGDVFLGYAYEKADNSAGAAGAIKVKIVSHGLVKVPLAGTPTQAKVGQLVYVNGTSDDATATLTADMDTTNTPVGVFMEYIDASYGYVLVDGFIGVRAGYQVRGLPTAEGNHRLSVIKATYDFAVDGGAIGSITLATIPSGVVVLAGVVDVLTGFTGSGTGALQLEGANDLITAAAVNGAPWSTAGRKALAANTNFGTASVKTTASRALTFDIASNTVTAGKFDVFLLVANL